MTVGERIKQRRKELGLTVDEVAERLGKNRATVYRYESNEIENLPTPILEPLSKVLDTTPEYLMGWKETESTPIETNRSALTKLLDQMAEPEIDSMIDYAEYLLSKRQNQV